MFHAIGRSNGNPLSGRLGRAGRRIVPVMLALSAMQSGCARHDAGPQPGAASSERVLMPDPVETVILVHGMGRTRASLAILARRLRSEGYRVLNFPYGTVSASMDEITSAFVGFVREGTAEAVAGAAAGGGQDEAVYHLVGHSLGNVIIRGGFREGYPPGLGRVVMLAPPNRPPRLARTFQRNPIYRWRCGDAGQRLADESFYAGLPVPPVPFGVIAGTRGHGLIFEGENDGVVACEETRLDGMTDWIALRHSHTFIMNSADTAGQCVGFLRTGAFSHPGGAAGG